MKHYEIETPLGTRRWHAEDAEHAREQHLDAFGNDDPDGRIVAVTMVDDCTAADPSTCH